MLKLRTYQYGSPREHDEGLRIGSTRYLPRGVPKENYAISNYFDVWLPSVAPSRELLQWFKENPEKIDQFLVKYKREMQQTESKQTILLLAKMAEKTPISIGCYCANESHCHRSVLRELIEKAAEN
jgi:uncharacterized protein YeaO (DUF488 family)